MNGIVETDLGQCKIIEIYNFTDELKQKIKDELTVICYGEYALVSGFEEHSFDSTIEELVNNRLSSDNNKKVGAIGELLLNVIIRVSTNMRIISPFFNLEERNAKKGFDIIAIDENHVLWLIEAKSGELGTSTSVTKKMIERINEGKRDLNKRLNEQRKQLWLNAVNSVRVALDDTSDKKTIVNILKEINNSNRVSSNKNVLLGGVVFCTFNSKIDIQKIVSLYSTIDKSRNFSQVKIIAIQKQTYQLIFDYLCSLT